MCFYINICVVLLQVDRAVELLENFNPSERADAINFLLIEVRKKFPEPTNEILNHLSSSSTIPPPRHQQQHHQPQLLNRQPHQQQNSSNNNNSSQQNRKNKNQNQCNSNSNFRKILCNENLVLVESEEDQDSDGSASSAVYSGSSVSLSQRRKGLKRTFLTSTPSSTSSGTITSYKRHFHEGRLLSERLILGECF